MSSTQFPKAVTRITPANPPPIAATARSQGGVYRIIEACSSPPPPIKADDAIDEILSCFLIWILPTFFLFGIIVLGTMLISYTIVMRISLPRLFTLIIVILFAALITITFFLLMAYHFRRSQRRIPFQRVRFTLSETSSVAGKGVPESSQSFSHSSAAEISQMSSLNVEAAAVGPPRPEPAFFAQDIPEIPLRRVKCYANIKQAAQNQNSNKALVLAAAQESTGSLRHNNSAPVSQSSSSHSSLENKTISDDNQWPLRPSLLQRPPPLTSPPATATTTRDAHRKEEAIYYLPPGPPSPVPSAAIRPIWADDIERQIKANQQASETGKHRKWWPK